MSDPQLDPDEVDLDDDDVRDSQGRRIDADYVQRAVDDVHRRRGRPSLTEGEESERLSVRVPTQTRRELDKRAAAEGRSASELAREAIDRYLASQE